MKVGIIGCGYIGLAISEKLQEAGCEVYGVRRSPGGILAVRASGANAVTADITEPETFVDIPSVDALIFAASSGRGNLEQAEAIYNEGLENVIDHFGQREHSPNTFLYTSSTSVLGDHDGELVDETTPRKPASDKAEILCAAEDIARDRAEAFDINPIVARLSGIYGPQRYRLDRYLTTPAVPGYRNFIHREDVAGAITHLLLAEYDETSCVHISDSEPVDRQEFVTWIAEQVNAPSPPLVSLEERLEEEKLSATTVARLRANKRVDNTRLRNTGYQFTYPTYREGFAQAIARYGHGAPT